MKGKHTTGKMISEKTCDLVKEFWYEVSRELSLKKFMKKHVPMYMLETSYIQAIQEIQARAEGGVCELHKVEVTKCPPNEGTRTSCVLLYQVQKCYTLHPALNHFTVQHNHSQLQVPVDTIAISSITLCPDTTRNEATCFQRPCKNCGVAKLSDHLAELTANHEECIVIYGSN